MNLLFECLSFYRSFSAVVKQQNPALNRDKGLELDPVWDSIRTSSQNCIWSEVTSSSAMSSSADIVSRDYQCNTAKLMMPDGI